jgi:hypothetical protein
MHPKGEKGRSKRSSKGHGRIEGCENMQSKTTKVLLKKPNEIGQKPKDEKGLPKDPTKDEEESRDVKPCNQRQPKSG